MATIAVRCDDCGRRYNLAADKLGKEVRCKECNAVFVVRDAGAEPVGRGRSEAPLRRDIRLDDDEVEPGDRPTRRTDPPAKGGGWMVPVILIFGGMGVLVFFGVCGLGAIVYLTSSVSSGNPANGNQGPWWTQGFTPPVAQNSPPDPGQLDPPKDFGPPRDMFPPIKDGHKPVFQPPPKDPPLPPVDPPKNPPLPPRDRPVIKPPDPPKEPAVAWSVQPDPLPAYDKGPFDTKTILKVAFMGKVIYPTRPGPFAALTPDKTKDTLIVYDLRTMQPVGPPIAAQLARYDHWALSPDGESLAAVRHDTNIFEVWDTRTGKSKQIAAGGRGTGILLLDFASKGRMIVAHHSINTDSYHIWDIESGKEVAHFDADDEYSPKWASLSNTGRYLVIERSHTTGYHLFVHDLTTGKRVGDLEFQNKDDEFGQASGIVFSPDGTEMAMLWRMVGNKVCWAKLWVWDTKTGKLKYKHDVQKEFKYQDSIWKGGPTSIQCLPDNSGWLLFGYFVLEHDTAAVVAKFPPEPGGFDGMERRYLNADYLSFDISQGFDHKVGVEKVPREEIDAAIKKARTEAKPK